MLLLSTFYSLLNKLRDKYKNNKKESRHVSEEFSTKYGYRQIKSSLSEQTNRRFTIFVKSQTTNKLK